MNLQRIGVIVRLELTQRLRSVSWYVLLGVFAVILLGVTALSYFVFSWQQNAGAGVYSVVVNIVLLLVVLISPTLSGNAINGDRENATLAAVQLTLASTAEIVFAKLIAAVLTGLAFLAVAVPFLLFSMVVGGVSPLTIVVSLLVLLAEIVIVAAIGVGFSGILARPLFSVAATYLTVAALVFGTVIVFVLGGTAVRSEAVSYSRPYVEQDNGEWDADCTRWETSTYEVPRFDYVWWALSANPFVVLADATPVTYDSHGNATDLFGHLKFGVRSAQLSPQLEQRWDDCRPYENEDERKTMQETIEGSVPSWFVGLGVQALIAGGLMAGALARTSTPARRLPPGTRIA